MMVGKAEKTKKAAKPQAEVAADASAQAAQLLQKVLTDALTAQDAGRMDEAVALFHKVLEIQPGNPAACYSLGVVALRDNDHAQAVQWANTGIAAAPNFAPLRFLAGSALRAAGANLDVVLKFYDDAIALQPNYIEALVNSGVVLRDMMRHKDALERFNRVLSIDPKYTTALANCGVLLTEFKQSEQAIAMFQRLLEVKPDYDFGQGLLCFERLHVCDWEGYEEVVAEIIAGTRAGKRNCKSLAMMSISDFAGDHFASAKLFGEHMYATPPRPIWQGEVYQHDRIRLAYISPDLREHPVGHLMTGVIERHDKVRFETIGISLGIDDGSRIRGRMIKAFDRFIDVRAMNSNQIAQLIRGLEVDVLVDLAGYTADSRPEVLVQRPAPVQVNFLGYAGSVAMGHMDYLIADRHVVPREHWPYYTEKIVYLPDAYMPTDSSLEIPEEAPPRSTYGLPEHGTVFCAFCHDYKISPRLFDIWMRVLQSAPDSVLWLMSRNEISQRNLCAAAQARGVDPKRLIFATRVPRVEDHLARYRLADVFLDTYPYNAHTTAADALMVGLPVLTCMGNGFHSRVAGSLAHAAGLPDLVTHSLQDYEALAKALAAQPQRVKALKDKLQAARPTSALFDTTRFTRNLEAAYVAMWRKTQLGDASDALLP